MQNNTKLEYLDMQRVDRLGAWSIGEFKIDQNPVLTNLSFPSATSADAANLTGNFIEYLYPQDVS
jgi:hypothetical protein